MSPKAKKQRGLNPRYLVARRFQTMLERLTLSHCLGCTLTSKPYFNPKITSVVIASWKKIWTSQ